MPNVTTLRKCLENARPKAKKYIKFLFECDDAMEGMDDEEVVLEPGEEGMGDEPAPDDQLKAGFKAAIAAVMDDDALDQAGKMQKIKNILKAEEMLKAEEAPEVPTEEDDESDDEEQPTEEALKRARKEAVKELCEFVGYKPDPAVLPLIEGCTDAKAMMKAIKALMAQNVNESKNHQRNGRIGARSQTTITESVAPKSTADFVAQLTARN